MGNFPTRELGGGRGGRGEKEDFKKETEYVEPCMTSVSAS